ncbi:tRNA pseudouridine synthase A [Thraustotheca clavata]|uniref:tRNA pseudouridine synthase n=1 Tax=Thraustotheca clavata TaxID=74557 RepID=A0A1V9ZK97_9STRA|nr:tRNA pseudouridine synthase A [Thraustotheca clavata]
MARTKRKFANERSYGSLLPTTAEKKLYRITLAYDGKNFKGFQAQENNINPRTVQATVENAILRTTGEIVRVNGASRTDKGVHARGQVASFQSAVEVASPNVLLQALNNRLPEDVAGVNLEVIDDSFDPRKHSSHKCYTYKLYCGNVRQILGREYAWQLCKPLNLTKMQEAAKLLVSDDGPRDFSAFTPTRYLDADANTLCHIIRVDIKKTDDEIVITFEGDRFLYKMIRIMVGLLVDVGLEKKDVEHVVAMVQSTERIESEGAPAQGLVLEWIKY